MSSYYRANIRQELLKSKTVDSVIYSVKRLLSTETDNRYSYPHPTLQNLHIKRRNPHYGMHPKVRHFWRCIPKTDYLLKYSLLNISYFKRSVYSEFIISTGTMEFSPGRVFRPINTAILSSGLAEK